MQKLNLIENISTNELPNSNESVIERSALSKMESEKDIEFNVLVWLLNWVCSDTNNLEAIGITYGQLDRLCRDHHLARNTRFHSNQKNVYSLDFKGADKLAEELGPVNYFTLNTMPLDIQLDRQKINRSLKIQRLTLLSLQNEFITTYIVPKTLDLRYPRNPDCIWITGNIKIGIALESEIRCGWDKSYFMHMIAKSLSSIENNILKLDRFIVFCTDGLVASEYGKQLETLRDQPLTILAIDEQKYCFQPHKINIAASILSKISVVHYEFKGSQEYGSNQMSDGEILRDFFHRL